MAEELHEMSDEEILEENDNRERQRFEIFKVTASKNPTDALKMIGQTYFPGVPIRPYNPQKGGLEEPLTVLDRWETDVKQTVNMKTDEKQTQDFEGLVTRLKTIFEQNSSEQLPEYESQVINEFKTYLLEYEAIMRSEISRNGSEALQDPTAIADHIYTNFYGSRSWDEMKYKPGSMPVAEIARIQKEYASNAITLITWLEAKERSSEGHTKIVGTVTSVEAKIQAGPERKYNYQNWIGCNINGGARSDMPMGRLYFNLKPEWTSYAFSKAVEVLSNQNIPCQVKVPALMETETDLNRLDKMVIYFNADQEKKILEFLKTANFLSDAQDETGVPRVTAPIQGYTGVSFGQEPLKTLNDSFGGVRSKILAEVYLEYRKTRTGFTLPDPKQNPLNTGVFDIKKSFKEACMKYNVDPKNPAFNMDEKAFGEIKKQMK